MQSRSNQLSTEEKGMIADICLIKDAAEAAKNLHPDVAHQLRNNLFHRMSLIFADLEELSRDATQKALTK